MDLFVPDNQKRAALQLPRTPAQLLSLAGNVAVSLTNFPAQQAQSPQCFFQAARCSSVGCQGWLCPGSPPTWMFPPARSKLQP